MDQSQISGKRRFVLRFYLGGLRGVDEGWGFLRDGVMIGETRVVGRSDISLIYGLGG
jgi:hypothetical protein